MSTYARTMKGAIIDACLRATRYSPADVEAKAGVAPGTISRALKGPIKGSDEDAIAAALGVENSDLFGLTKMPIKYHTMIKGRE